MTDIVFMILVALLFVVCVVVAALLTNKPKISSIVLTVLALALLVWKAIEFCQYFVDESSFPYEISHWAYLVVGVIVLFSIKPLYLFGGFLAIISGLGYIIGALASPETYISNQHYLIGLSITSHLALLLIGFLLTFNVRRYKSTETIISLLGLFAIVGYGSLIANDILYPSHLSTIHRSAIYQIMTGDLLEYIIDPADITDLMRAFVPIGVLALAVILLFVFFAINRGLYKSRAKKVNLTPETMPLTPVGPIELIKYAATGRKDQRELLVYNLQAATN